MSPTRFLLASSGLWLCACSTSLLGLPSRAAVARYVSTGDAGMQHVCVMPYGRGMRAPYAWVFWQERRRLVLWERLSRDEDSLVHARRSLDLDTQVAETEDGVGQHGHVVTRAWVDDILRDCRSSGVRYTIDTTAR